MVQCRFLVDCFIDIPECGPFLEPVDWRGLGLTDYPTIVTTPMDLGTVRRKLVGEE
jgi:hypothetical protein